tara:strand:- start:79 stop:237 length:159 start_codon:yes stop_codon:yes gene_type:complete
MKNIQKILRLSWDFLKIRKKYWLFPSIMILTMLIIIIFTSGGSVIAPFVYSF